MNQNAIRSGLLIGVIGIILSLLIYIVNSSLFGNTWLMLGLGVINLVLITYFGVKYRNDNGGFLSFKDAYVYAIISMVCMVVVTTVFSFVLFTVVDPGLPEIIADAAVENAESMMRSFGTPEEVMEEQLDKARQDTLDGFTTGGMIQRSGVRILINLVICLILAVIIRRKEPEELE